MEFYRKIYRLSVTLLSPLSVGSGANAHTDKDVIVDGAGAPFIPATAIAGVLRSYVAKTSGPVAANAVFGYLPDGGEKARLSKKGDAAYRQRECILRVYDGLPDDRGCGTFITSRDMVKLEEKVGVDGAKFDMEAVETGARFTAYLELLRRKAAGGDGECEIDAERETEAALAALNGGLLRLGSKTTRGYGQVSLAVKARVFTDALSWIGFDMTRETEWEEIPPLSLNDTQAHTLTLGLRLKGGISVREYLTDPGEPGETMPDQRQLALHARGSDGLPVPVIPGTSWAGAIRARFLELSGNDTEETDALFGFVRAGKTEGVSETQRSVIVFSESSLTGGVWKRTTRNAIDRFSGKTKDGALYTEETYYGGTTQLAVSFLRAPAPRQAVLLAACFADLHNGFLAVGGLTTVGRGLFSIERVNGRPLSEDERGPERIFETLKKEIGSND